VNQQIKASRIRETGSLYSVNLRKKEPAPCKTSSIPPTWVPFIRHSRIRNRFTTANPGETAYKLLEKLFFIFAEETESYLLKTPDPTLDHKEAYA
jgi:hypothetical protein